MCSCKSCYGYPERGTTHVVQTILMAEFDRVRVAAVFAADADPEFRPSSPNAIDAGISNNRIKIIPDFIFIFPEESSENKHLFQLPEGFDPFSRIR